MNKHLPEIYSYIFLFKKEVTSFKVFIFLENPEDSSNYFLSINLGAGGTES
jgi:hypothetical protein